MAQTVFRPDQVKNKDGEFVLQLTHDYAPPQIEAEPVDTEPVYEGPTADDLRREAEAFKVQWEAEKQTMLEQAQASADAILQNAHDSAFAEVKRQTDHAQVIKTEAEEKAAQIVSNAESQAKQIVEQADAERTAVIEASKKEGFELGQQDGFKEGKAEADRLIGRIHTMLEYVMHRRQEILDETEQQIVELVLLMARKVIKVMSDSQKSVVMANVVSALRKVKGRGDVIIRVNLEDVKLTTDHAKDFVREVENVQNVKVIEDSTVEKGGCIIETDFGAIDARISSQLAELEQKILEISPVKSMAKGSVVNQE